MARKAAKKAAKKATKKAVKKSTKKKAKKPKKAKKTKKRKAKRVSKVAKGSRRSQRSQVFRGKKAYKRIAGWTAAVQKARKALGCKGFVAIKKGSALYNKAKGFYKK